MQYWRAVDNLVHWQPTIYVRQQPLFGRAARGSVFRKMACRFEINVSCRLKAIDARIISVEAA